MATLLERLWVWMTKDPQRSCLQNSAQPNRESIFFCCKQCREEFCISLCYLFWLCWYCKYSCSVYVFRIRCQGLLWYSNLNFYGIASARNFLFTGWIEVANTTPNFSMTKGTFACDINWQKRSICFLKSRLWWLFLPEPFKSAALNWPVKRPISLKFPMWNIM